MRRSLIYVWALLLLALLAGCEKETEVSTGESVIETESPAVTPDEFVKVCFSDEMIALIEDQLSSGSVETKSAPLNEALSMLDVASMERVFPDAGEFEPGHRMAGLHKWYKVKYRSGVPMTKAMDDLSSVPGVEFVEPNLPAKLMTNDTYWGDLWGVYNPTYGYDVNVTEVWNRYTTGNPDVVVAVIDGGIQLDHPDLAWNCLESGHQNYVRSGGIVPHSHGTHVAGTIAAVGNNGIGVAGIAGGDYLRGKRGVSLLSLQVFQTIGESSVSNGFEQAMVDAADKGAVISQNSWGYNFDRNDNGKVDEDELSYYKYYYEHINNSAIAEAIDYFVLNAGCEPNTNGTVQRKDSPMKGGLVVFAAGNENIQYGPPANYEPCIAVGAITKSGKRASFSDFGDWVDVCAPGYNIISTYPEGKYATTSGTSMACPHVSGVAALVLSYFGGPGFTAEALRTRILDGARDIGLSSGSTPVGPLVDALGAFMSGGGKIPDPIEDFTVEPVGHNLKLSFKATDAYGYMALGGLTEAMVRNVDLMQPSSELKTAQTIVSLEEQGKEVSLLLTGLQPNTTYYTAIAAFSYERSWSELSKIIAVKTNENHKPTVSVVDYQGNFQFRYFEDVDILFRVEDPDGDPVTVSFETNGRGQFAADADGLYHFTLMCQLVHGPAEFNAAIMARDDIGASVTHNFRYTVLKNVPPVQVKDFSAIILPVIGQTTSFDLAPYFTDEDGENLDYKIYMAEAFAEARVEESTVTVKAVSTGVGRLRVTVSDRGGEQVQVDIPIVVRSADEPVTFKEGRVVTKTLTIMGSVEDTETSVRILSSTGAVVFDKTALCSVFSPMQLDVSAMAPGVYQVVVSYGGNTYNYTILKR